ncbi:MAG: thrombospondin type 3 repeat-containing protein [Myxococcota bacterium]
MKLRASATICFALWFALPFASTAGLAPDADSDGVPDVLDNCSTTPNAAPFDCDTDKDGYGNACDGDFDQDFDVDGVDFNPGFLSVFTGSGLPSPTGTDMDCDGDVDGSDFNPVFLNQFTGSGAPGPSGLNCAGQPGCC